jgi:hypothetical protein
MMLIIRKFDETSIIMIVNLQLTALAVKAWITGPQLRRWSQGVSLVIGLKIGTQEVQSEVFKWIIIAACGASVVVRIA